MPKSLVLLTLSFLVGVALFQDCILKVLVDVLNRSDSSHGIFVPFLAAYFLWTLKDRIRETPIGTSWAGAPVILICIGFALAGVGGFQVQFIAFIGFLCGLILIFLGNAMFKILAYPLIFLVTMTPLPQQVYNDIADLSRTIAFGASVQVLSLLGIPHMRVGWDLELPNALLRVTIDCSGIRYLISYVAFGFAYAFIFKTSFSGRILTAIATIPLSIFASILRLTTIFLMTYWISPFWSQRKPHIFLSWLVFFGVLILAIWIDQWFQKRRIAKTLNPLTP